MAETSTALPDRRVPESIQHSVLAEFAAGVCRDIAGGLLSTTGDDLVPFLEREVGRLRQALEDPFALGEGSEPRHPPVFDRRGRIAVATNPVVSHRNAIAPLMKLVRSGDECEFTVELPLQYQGPPGKLHGGYSAVLLDEALWKAVRVNVSAISFTRELTISYERPVPLFESVTVLARVTEVDGRKTFAEGEILAGGEVCSRAHGLWISPRPRE